jgi:2-C-methyl-D-erythritol 4-phosphate cytidylyltransferase
MNTDIPKQFLLLSGQPVLMHSIRVFHRFDPQMQLLVVLPEDLFPAWDMLCQQHSFTLPHKLVAGGVTRFHSVKNALEFTGGEGLVAIHDGARPLVSKETLSRAFEEAAKSGNAVPVIRMNESVRRTMQGGSTTVDREDLRIVQTPQVFRKELIKRAYASVLTDDFTDDATVVETLGVTLNLVEGNPENIKITLPHDLIVAEAIFSSSAPQA